MVHFLFAWVSGVKRSFSGEGLGYVCKRAFKLLCKQELQIKDKNQRTDTQETDISLTSSEKLQSGSCMYRTGLGHMLDLSLVLILPSQVTKGQLSKLKRGFRTDVVEGLAAIRTAEFVLRNICALG